MNSTKEYGQFLREEREKQGLTLEDVSKGTRITVKILYGLESMEKDLFPSETYRIGMLKVYARYLKIDINIILDMLKINEIQEKPVEFDLINLQAEKRKKRMKIAMKVIMVIGLVVLAWAGYKIINTMIVINAEKKEQQQLSTDKFERIDGFYEANFSLNEKLVLTNGSAEGIFEIISINPSLIMLDDNEFELSVNTPLQLDIDNDESPDYTILLRQVNISRKQLLLRFDPSINANVNIISQDDLTGGFANIVSDGEEIEVLTSVSKLPIQVELVFTQDSYYKFLDDQGNIKEAEAVAKDGKKSLTSNDPFQVLISNSNFVDIVVNNTPVNIPKTGLPYSFYVGWKYKEGKSVLTLVPTP